MLESYDPQWKPKWERANARLKALNDKPAAERSSADIVEQRNLANLLGRISEASCRTANDLIDLYAPYFLLPATRLGLSFEIPRLPDNTDYDTAHAVLRAFEEHVGRGVRKVANGLAEPLDTPVSFPERRPLATWWERLCSRIRRSRS